MNVIQIKEHPDKIVYTECWCNSPYHAVRWYVDDRDSFGSPRVSCELFLNPLKLSFWERLKIAFKYLFKCGDYAGGVFDEFEVKPEDLQKLESLIKQLR